MAHTSPTVPKVAATVPEACASLGIGRTQFYEFVKAGIIRPVKIGAKGVRVPVSELHAAIERLRETEAA